MIIRTINLENPTIAGNNQVKTIPKDEDKQFSSLLKNALDKSMSCKYKAKNINNC